MIARCCCLLAACSSSRAPSARLSADVPAIIVGGGRIGSLLKDIGMEGDVILRRDEPFPSSPAAGPIYVCTRNDALQGIIDATPPERRADLCFLQNGMLGSFLEKNGLTDNTQVLLYLAVSKLGEKPIDGVTKFNPDGLTAATGKWADAFAARLAGGGLKCRALAGEEYKAAMLEKHVWICSFMMVGALNGGITVGEVGEAHTAQLEALVAELCQSGEIALGVTLADGAFDRLLAYGRSVAHFPTAVKEFDWRNGWFYDLSQAAMAAGRPDPTPIHTAGLKTLGQIA